MIYRRPRWRRDWPDILRGLLILAAAVAFALATASYLVGLRRWVGGAAIGMIEKEYTDRGVEMEPIPESWRERRAAGRD